MKNNSKNCLVTVDPVQREIKNMPLNFPQNSKLCILIPDENNPQRAIVGSQTSPASAVFSLIENSNGIQTSYLGEVDVYPHIEESYRNNFRDYLNFKGIAYNFKKGIIVFDHCSFSKAPKAIYYLFKFGQRRDGKAEFLKKIKIDEFQTKAEFSRDGNYTFFGGVSILDVNENSRSYLQLINEAQSDLSPQQYFDRNHDCEIWKNYYFKSHRECKALLVHFDPNGQMKHVAKNSGNLFGMSCKFILGIIFFRFFCW